MRNEDFTIERFYESYDRSDGTTAWYESLAIAWAEYDDQLSGRLSAMDWDDHHIKWDDAHELSTGETGAWTCDTDPETLAALRDRGIPIPESRREIPINADVQPVPAVERECRLCRTEALLSVREIARVYPTPTTPMRIALHDSTEATHVCEACESFFSYDDRHREGEDAADSEHESDGGFNLAEVM